MTPARLHDLGSALEAAAVMAPGSPIPINPLEIAHALMWAAAQLTEKQHG